VHDCMTACLVLIRSEFACLQLWYTSKPVLGCWHLSSSPPIKRAGAGRRETCGPCCFCVCIHKALTTALHTIYATRRINRALRYTRVPAHVKCGTTL
jgi:hypothetical protein